MIFFMWIFLGYLAGSFPSGYLSALWVKGVDIRTTGSGATGATNVGRLLGKKWAVAVAVVDMLKGAVPMVIARLWGVDEPWLLSLTGFAGVLGHNYPVWLAFRGGKGVATTYGVVFFLFPPLSYFLAPAGGIIWFVLLKTAGYVSLASLISLWCLPLFSLAFSLPSAYTFVLCALALLATFRHKENIRRLLEGNESRFGRHGKS